MRQFIAVFAFLICMTGCTKDFHLDPDQVKEVYVIDGRISNLRGPYHIRVSKTMGLYLPIDWAGSGANPDTATPVTNALVIISDDSGITDTLIPATNKFEGMMYTFNNRVFDSVYRRYIEVNMTRERGFYQTTKLTGIPGRTYRLRVEVDGQVFESSATMPPVPALEYVEMRDTTIAPFTNVGPIPVAYFKDPPGEKNYYLLKNYDFQKYPYDNYFENSTTRNGGVNYIDYYFFDDKFLIPGLNAIASQQMFDYSRFESYPFAYLGNYDWPIHVRLCSLTKEAYDYIKIMSKQVLNDGNIYKPSPATPPGNISGGALGLFTASHISDKLLFPK